MHRCKTYNTFGVISLCSGAAPEVCFGDDFQKSKKNTSCRIHFWFQNGSSQIQAVLL